eukprot:TRINITY_DN3600_c0_g1_i1.p1 TRINITY_DN3600_c0_g1~~TRINITY_DN3600_c0_g1_i1.p1  ORF type:complete len:237 (-),score=47.35 TRINITY_DN3600_c0_g1_i1:2-712(-)
MFSDSLQSVERHVRKDNWYMDVHMSNGAVVWPLANSLGCFWPGLLALAGAVDDGARAMKSLHTVWRKYGAFPEGYSVASGTAQPGQKGYPLRPELAESAYVLYRMTGDAYWQVVGRDMVVALQANNRVAHGFAAMEDVETRELRDTMDSFFLAETLKYLYLLFDTNNFVNTGSYVFNTEGHILPFVPQVIERFNETTVAANLRGRCITRSYHSRLAADGVRFPDPTDMGGSQCRAT